MNTESQRRCRTARGRSGPSSYNRHDPESIFSRLELRPGHAFLDLGCGRGDYSVHAAGLVGDEGVVYALEKDEHYAETLAEQAAEDGIDNLITMIGDMTAPLILKDNTVDVCLACTCMHFLNLSTHGRQVFREVRRVLRPGGLFAVVECSKEDLSFGPPEHMRNDPEEYAPIIRDTGFIQQEYIPMGFLYMLLFRVPMVN